MIDPLGPYISRLHLVILGNMMENGSSPSWYQKSFVKKIFSVWTSYLNVCSLISEELNPKVNEVTLKIQVDQPGIGIRMLCMGMDQSELSSYLEIPVEEDNIEDEIDEVETVT